MRQKQGAALILVLTFIIMLSLLVLSFLFFNRSNLGGTDNYAKAIQAQEIALGGLDDIVTDLRLEIAAGSNVKPTGTLPPVYIPGTDRAPQPARLGFQPEDFGNDLASDRLPPTLLRVSRATVSGTGFEPADIFDDYDAAKLPPNRASFASTGTPAANGRAISLARWNKPQLLTTVSGSVPQPFADAPPDWVYVTRAGSRACADSDLSKMLPQPLGDTAPADSVSPVVGRYAYVVYDEGALLDINVIGYPAVAGSGTVNFSNNPAVIPSATATFSGSNVSVNPAQITLTLSAKSSLACANLLQLPGFKDIPNGQTAIDQLLAWRNASVKTNTAADFFTSVLAYASAGYLTFQTTDLGTDSPVMNRQDLLNYFNQAATVSGTALTRALPYLGTFHRASTAPSWCPTNNSPDLPGYYGFRDEFSSVNFTNSNFGNINYLANADADRTTHAPADGQVPNPNRAIPNLRHTAAFPAIHYRDDGTTEPYQVKVGDPVVPRRFSLAKLSWLTPTGPKPGISAAAIEACFGLRWENENWSATPAHPDRWVYVAHANNPQPPTRTIKTLSEVIADRREPNFFELLKAGILAGSIGQSPGPPNETPINTKYDGLYFKDFESVSKDKDRHILQIGANIIDQYDTDSIPVAIYMDMFGAANTEQSFTADTVFGVENLPGLTRYGLQSVEDWVWDSTGTWGGSGTINGAWKTWLLPELWNIHQAPATGVDLTPPITSGSLPSGYPRPVKFRLRAYGQLMQVNAHNQSIGRSGISPIINYSANSSYNYHDASSTYPPTGQLTTVSGSQAGTIYFIDFANATSPFYRFPQNLRLDSLYESGSAAFDGTHLLNLANESIRAMTGDMAGQEFTAVEQGGSWQGTRFAAIFAGEDPTFPALALNGNTLAMQMDIRAITPFTLSVECQNPDTGRWHPYSFMARYSGREFTGGSRVLGDDCGGYGKGDYLGTPGTVGASASNGRTNLTRRGDGIHHVDPRTDRFSCVMAKTQGNGDSVNRTLFYAPNAILTASAPPDNQWGFVTNPVVARNVGFRIGMWVFNSSTIPASFSYASNAFYVDPDGVVRPGDGYRSLYVGSMSTHSGDGIPSFHGTGGNSVSATKGTTGQWPISYQPTTTTVATKPAASLLPTTTAASPTGSAQARRPVVLNRPFRSVAELGYAFRDLPFKSLDFFSQYTGDGALLDLFTVSDQPPVTAGEINLSNAPAPILAAILTGAGKMEINNPRQDANFISVSDALTLSGSLAATLREKPLANRADLPVALDPILTRLVTSSTASWANKAYAEAPVRALANNANTRVWNLMIDIIAQTGRMKPAAATLSDFVVEGEKRYWLHVAIDRYTGKIIDQQLEPVYE